MYLRHTAASTVKLIGLTKSRGNKTVIKTTYTHEIFEYTQTTGCHSIHVVRLSNKVQIIESLCNTKMQSNNALLLSFNVYLQRDGKTNRSKNIMNY